MSDPKLSFKGLHLLSALQGRDDLCGADLHRITGVGHPTLYQAMARFEDAGWVASRWEDVDPKKVGRPRRRFYVLTTTGRTAVEERLAAVSAFK